MSIEVATSDRGWWEVLGVDRAEAASWHLLNAKGKRRVMAQAFKRAVNRLAEIEEWTVVPLLNAYSEGRNELLGAGGA